MNSYKNILLPIISFLLILSSCNKDEPVEIKKEPQLIFKFKFDSSQARLDNFENPSNPPAGNAGQSPVFHGIGAHYVELSPNDQTALGSGFVVYSGPTTSLGGASAIDFEKEKLLSEGETYLSIPLKDVTPGTYSYLRVSLSYQNYDLKFRYGSLDLTGRLASFVGFNSYIKAFKQKIVLSQ